MTNRQRDIQAAGSPTGRHTPTEHHLSGWPLVLARLLVLVVSALTIGLGIYALILWQHPPAPCADALNSCLLTPEQVAPLQRFGMTPMSLTVAVVALDCVVIVLANGVAAVLVWRRSDDAMALLVVVTLVTLPAFFTPMYQSLSGGWRHMAEVIDRLGGLSFLMLLALFPSGRFVPRWIWLPVVALVAVVSGVGPSWMKVVAVPIALLTLLCLIAGQIYRYRVASSPLEHQQTRWVVGGLILSVLVNQLFWQPAAWIPALQRKDSLV